MAGKEERTDVLRNRIDSTEKAGGEKAAPEAKEKAAGDYIADDKLEDAAGGIPYYGPWFGDTFQLPAGWNKGER